MPVLFSLGIGLDPIPTTYRESLNTLTVLHRAPAERDLEDAWSTVLQWEPWRADLWERFGSASLESGQLDSALQALERSEMLRGITKEGQLHLGDAYRMNGELANAIEVYSQLIEGPEPVMNAYPRLVQAYRSMGNISGAVAVVEKWKQAEQNPAEADYLEGLLLSVDDPIRAMDSLWAAMADPGVAGRANALRTRLSEAEAQPDIYRLVLTGRALGSLGEWDLAARAFHSTVELDSAYAEAWALLGEAHQQLGEDGWPELEKAQTLDETSVVVRALLALYWRRQGKTTQAMEVLSSLAADEPRQAFWQMELGNTAVLLNDLVEALRHYQKATQLEPENPVYWKALAVFSTSMGVQVRQVGLPAARQLVILDPGSADSYAVLGWTLYWLEDWYSAERSLLDALEVDPHHPGANLHLGQVYLQTDDTDRAYRYIAQAESYSTAGDEINRAAVRLLEEYFHE